MALHQYIGARYVPRFYENSDGTAEWRSGVIYEPLTIVTWNGNSYTSKKTIPSNIGNPSANPDYWAATGVYNEQVQELRDEVTVLNDAVISQRVRRVIVIGDSYAEGTTAGGVTDSFTNFVASHLQLGPGNFYKFSTGGSGFVGNNAALYTFQELMENGYATVSHPETITDIIFVGGANDLGGDQALEDAVLAAINRANVLYPNAYIGVAFVGNNTFAASTDRIMYLLGAFRYQQAVYRAVATRVYYVNNGPLALKGGGDIMSTDHLHPTKRGYMALGEFIAGAIISHGEGPLFCGQLNGNGFVGSGKVSGVGAGTFRIWDRRRIDGSTDVIIESSGLDQLKVGSDGLTNAGWNEIGTIGSGGVHGASPQYLTSKPVHAIIRVSTNPVKYIETTAMISFANDKVYLYLNAIDSNTGSYVSFENASEIDISPTILNYDSRVI